MRSISHRAYLTFVIQMAGVTKVFPNIEMHPEFGTALKEAEDAGVKVLYLPCRVTTDSIAITHEPEKECQSET